MCVKGTKAQINRWVRSAPPSRILKSRTLNVAAIKLHFIVRFCLRGEWECVNARVTNISFLNYAIFIEISSLVYCHARMFLVARPLHLTFRILRTSVVVVVWQCPNVPGTLSANNATCHLGPTLCRCVRNVDSMFWCCSAVVAAVWFIKRNPLPVTRIRKLFLVNQTWNHRPNKFIMEGCIVFVLFFVYPFQY